MIKVRGFKFEKYLMIGGGLVDEVDLSSERRLTVSGADEAKSGPTISTPHQHTGSDHVDYLPIFKDVEDCLLNMRFLVVDDNCGWIHGP